MAASDVMRPPRAELVGMFGTRAGKKSLRNQKAADDRPEPFRTFSTSLELEQYVRARLVATARRHLELEQRRYGALCDEDRRKPSLLWSTWGDWLRDQVEGLVDGLSAFDPTIGEEYRACRAMGIALQHVAGSRRA